MKTPAGLAGDRVAANPAPQVALPRRMWATVSIYAFGGGAEFTLPIQSHFNTNTRFQFVLVYTVTRAAKDAAVSDVRAAVQSGALRVGAEHGLPLHRFPLEHTAAAHAAVESGAVGKVVIDIA